MYFVRVLDLIVCYSWTSSLMHPLPFANIWKGVCVLLYITCIYIWTVPLAFFMTSWLLNLVAEFQHFHPRNGSNVVKYAALTMKFGRGQSIGVGLPMRSSIFYFVKNCYWSKILGRNQNILSLSKWPNVFNGLLFWTK